MHFPEYDAVSHKFVAFNMHTGGPMVFIVDCKVRTTHFNTFDSEPTVFYFRQYCLSKYIKIINNDQCVLHIFNVHKITRCIHIQMSPTS